MTVETEIQCRCCREVTVVRADHEDLERWRAGALIQRALPYLSADERQLLISQTCGKCWERIFK